MADAKAPRGPQTLSGLLDRRFGLTASGTTIRTEFVAGLTTFLTMVYIVFVNPDILANAGMDRGAVFVATCLAAAISTLVMALYANYPIALAPGMGLNAFFAFTLVLGYKYTWQQALGFVFVSGLLALAITATRLREAIIAAIPHNLKLAVSAGVGLFLGIIALQQAGIVVDHPATLVTLGSLREWPPILALCGFVLIVALNARRVLGGTLIGILAVTLAALALGLVDYRGVVSMPPSLAPTFLQLDFSRIVEATALFMIFTLLFVDLFDTAGTLIGVSHRAGLLDQEGNLPRMGRALVADSTATTVGALLGTSNTTSYIESAAGVEAGGRTGLTGVFVALLFLLALFFAPLAGMIPKYASAAALLYVACVMTHGLAALAWDDITEYAPAVMTAVAMPLTFSIATGIGLGFITYALCKLLSGRIAQAKPAVLVLAALFAVKFAMPY
ncbi:MAG: NCS2 family permease [Hyphomicrobiales bacterium]|nr:NCS2 family permease [Hyphomicrobiales bacterium]